MLRGRLTPSQTCLASPLSPPGFLAISTLNKSLDLNLQGLLLNTLQRPGEPHAAENHPARMCAPQAESVL